MAEPCTNVRGRQTGDKLLNGKPREMRKGNKPQTQMDGECCEGSEATESDGEEQNRQD